jgi:uncharacterized protein GlcG (DUF336 family)
MPREISSLTLADARQIISAAEGMADGLGVSYNNAVVDAGGDLVAHARMDGAWVGSIDLAINKASTARAFGMAPENLDKMAQSGKPLSTNSDRTVIFAGGVPAEPAGQVIGGINASGGTVDQDGKVVAAAAGALGSEQQRSAANR